MGPELSVTMDNLDRDVFPRRGHRVDAHAMIGFDPHEATSFNRAFVAWHGRWMLSQRVSLIGRGALGAARDDVPPHYRFYLGGPFEQPALNRRLIPLFGASTNELSGTYLQTVGVGVQLQIRDLWIVGGQWNAGWAGDEWSWPPEKLRPGFGLSVGREILFVPVLVAIGARSVEGPYSVWVNLGYEF